MLSLYESSTTANCGGIFIVWLVRLWFSALHKSLRICLQVPPVLQSRLQSLGQVGDQVYSVFPSPLPRH